MAWSSACAVLAFAAAELLFEFGPSLRNGLSRIQQSSHSRMNLISRFQRGRVSARSFLAITLGQEPDAFRPCSESVASLHANHFA
jgi:hypothetical protein